VHLRGERQINEVLEALKDYRRHARPSDYRKSDGIGIARDGMEGELVEVTTVTRRLSAEKQLREKLDTLTRTVNRIHNLSTRWRPSPWKPQGPGELYYSVAPTRVILSFEPTYRENSPDGVILYEVLDMEPEQQPQVVSLPESAADTIRRRQAASPVGKAGPKGWADELGVSNPSLIGALRAVALVGGAAMTVAAVVAALDPIPGDEIAAYAAASALITFALRGGVPSAYERPT